MHSQTLPSGEDLRGLSRLLICPHGLSTSTLRPFLPFPSPVCPAHLSPSQCLAILPPSPLLPPDGILMAMFSN